MQESIGLFEQKMQEQRQNLARMREFDKLRKTVRTAGAAEGESELSRVTTVQKKMIVGEEFKVSVMLREDEKERERREGAVKMREVRRGLNRKMGEKNAKRRAMEMSETMLSRQMREEARKEICRKRR
ncbi:uncharacterized protein MONOS_7214 [Monocercomonoides exilis]|uniref:uncharacterized protein n=1 Tax=Monocercomonoides exilis TaxID=2049356 RepID=UPI003559B12A|nr:hypothetical protein MONOS_7214 [Monocercomonoides exilis]